MTTSFYLAHNDFSQAWSFVAKECDCEITIVLIKKYDIPTEIQLEGNQFELIEELTALSKVLSHDLQTMNKELFISKLNYRIKAANSLSITCKESMRSKMYCALVQLYQALIEQMQFIPGTKHAGSIRSIAEYQTLWSIEIFETETLMPVTLYVSEQTSSGHYQIQKVWVGIEASQELHTLCELLTSLITEHENVGLREVYAELIQENSILNTYVDEQGSEVQLPSTAAYIVHLLINRLEARKPAKAS